MNQPDGFDIGAAWLRRAQGDLGAFIEGLAARLEGALPGCVTVERQRAGLLSSRRHVTRISVRFENDCYELALKSGQLVARRVRTVRGVAISKRDMPVPAWLDSLRTDIAALGASQSAASAVLHDFLMS